MACWSSSLEAAESDSVTDQQKAGLKSKVQSVSKEHIIKTLKCTYTGRFTPFIHHLHYNNCDTFNKQSCSYKLYKGYESGVLNDQLHWSAVPFHTHTRMVSTAGRSVQVMSLIFSSLWMYFFSLIPLVWSELFYDPSCLIHGLRSAQTQREAAVLLLLYFLICSQTGLLMG